MYAGSGPDISFFDGFNNFVKSIEDNITQKPNNESLIIESIKEVEKFIVISARGVVTGVSVIILLPVIPIMFFPFWPLFIAWAVNNNFGFSKLNEK